MNERSTIAVRFALKGVVLAVACLWGGQAAALGLGRLTVQSALGETLRAEVEVTSITAEEAATLTLRVAPPDAYRAAGVDYNAVLPTASLQIVRRPDGRSVLRLTSDRAVLEPFVDVILEATWASGRLVREYTMLFDPPPSSARPGLAAGVATSPLVSPSPLTPPAVTSPVAPPSAPLSTPLPGAATTPPTPSAGPRVATEAPRPAPRSAAAPRAGTEEAPASAARPGVDAYRVRAGDSLSRIAGRTQRPGVSLDQMLVGLFRANPQAFVGDNMNRLLAGTVLTVPATDELNKLAPAAARQVIVAQSSDFAAYRQRLASGVTSAADEAPSRVAKGQVQTRVDDRKQGANPPPDRLTLSQGSAKASGPTGAEAKVSKDTERKDSDARIAELARNVEELKKLQGTTAADRLPAVAPAAPAPAVAAGPAPATATTPAPTTATVPTVPPGTSPVVAALPVTPPVVPAVPAAPPTAGASGVTAAAPQPPVAAAPTPEAGGFLDSLGDSSLVLPAAGALVLLLAGLGLYRLRRRLRRPAGETSFLESRLQPDSFFGASGGQRIDTREAAAAPNSSSMSYSLSQLDAIGDVDPVAEADVYLAYGRDLQAEEILKEAMRSTPERLAIRSKLLEVYAKRRDTKGYELLASQLFNLTRGEGDEWAKAQALGLTIDSDNALYQPGGHPDEVRGNSGQPVEALGASTVPYTEPPPLPTFKPTTNAGTLDLDLDLDLDMPLAGGAASERPPSASETTQALGVGLDFNNDDDTLEFDRSSSMGKTVPIRRPATAPLAAKPPVVPGARPVAPPPADNGLDFDLGSLSLDSPATLPGPIEAGPAEGSLDFSDFGLDANADNTPDGDPLARKLELAEEFRQIGDLEGARDLLEEVVAKAQGSLKSKAQGMLNQLG